MRQPVEQFRAGGPFALTATIPVPASRASASDPVAAVDPESGEIRRDDQSADRTRETAQPAPRLPALGRYSDRCGSEVGAIQAEIP